MRTTERADLERDGFPLAASRDHACPRCRNGLDRLTLHRADPRMRDMESGGASLGLLRWWCDRCDYYPPQWAPTGRRAMVIGMPSRVSSLDFRSPHF